MAEERPRSLIYHVAFSTKGRKSVLFDEIRDLVLAEFSRVSAERGIQILEVEAIYDHVHLLLDLKPNQKVSVVMHDLKGASARAVFLAYPELRLDMQSNSFWQRGYGARLVPPRQIPVVRQYIRTQDERPLRHV